MIEPLGLCSIYYAGLKCLLLPIVDSRHLYPRAVAVIITSVLLRKCYANKACLNYATGRLIKILQWTDARIAVLSDFYYTIHPLCLQCFKLGGLYKSGWSALQPNIHTVLAYLWKAIGFYLIIAVNALALCWVFSLLCNIFQRFNNPSTFVLNLASLLWCIVGRKTPNAQKYQTALKD